MTRIALWLLIFFGAAWLCNSTVSAETKLENTERFLRRELANPTIANSKRGSPLVDEHWIPSVEKAVPKLIDLEAGRIAVVPLVAYGNRIAPDRFVLAVRWLQNSPKQPRLTLSDKSGVLAEAVAKDVNIERPDYFREITVYLVVSTYSPSEDDPTQAIVVREAVDDASLRVSIGVEEGAGDPIDVCVFPSLTAKEFALRSIQPLTPVTELAQKIGKPERGYEQGEFVVLVYDVEGTGYHIYCTKIGEVAWVTKAQDDPLRLEPVPGATTEPAPRRTETDGGAAVGK